MSYALDILKHLDEDRKRNKRFIFQRYISVLERDTELYKDRE